MRLRLTSLTLILAACQAADPPEIGSRDHSIIGGTRDSGDPAVVYIELSGAGGQGACTGTLISPHVIITAAHCEDQFNTWYVYWGTDPSAQSSASVIQHIHHPNWNGEPGGGYDFALLRIDRNPPSGVEPVPINRTYLDDSSS